MKKFFIISAALLLASCTGSSVPGGEEESPAAVPPQAATPIPPELASPLASWDLSREDSLYRRLYADSQDVLDFEEAYPQGIDESPPADIDGDGKITKQEEIEHHRIDDRIVNAVAADLVTQFYRSGTNPVYTANDDLVIWRSDDLVPIPPADITLEDSNGNPLSFAEVQLFVRDAIFLSPAETCSKWTVWWKMPNHPILNGETGETLPPCTIFVSEVRDAVQRERELEDLRHDLTYIAYGEERIWDGELAAGDSELRTYDLLADVVGAGNMLGSAPFAYLFAEGNQGEQCDSDLCPACILPAQQLCGDGAVQGAEQCDDGNRFPGDGCDAFCQVEQNYCGNGTQESWEACDEGKECPDGSACTTYANCMIGDQVCPYDNPEDCGGYWSRTCRYTGARCSGDADCLSSCPFNDPDKCVRWIQNSCAYRTGGVCTIGNILEGSSCTGQADCSNISSCDNGFCTNHPYKQCTEDAQCFSCRQEEITGTCYQTGEECNGNEDCPDSGYCMLEPEDICKPRLLGGSSGDEASTCNGYCEDTPRCGDRVTYLDENGNIEECDDGMQCDDGTECSRGQTCADGSFCKPRNGDGTSISCSFECKMQICGDGDPYSAGGEQCDTGATCIDGSACNLLDNTSCQGLGTCRDTSSTNPNARAVCRQGSLCQSIIDTEGNAHPNPCIADESCTPRSNDGDACNAFCQSEYCGDAVLQDASGEVCDNGGVCDNGTRCSLNANCPTYDYCSGNPDRACSDDRDCPRGSTCLSANGTPQCNPVSNDGCTADCSTREFCGDGTVQNGSEKWQLHEECDDGNVVSGDGCSALCKRETTSPSLCGNGDLDPGEQCDDGNTNSGDGCSSFCTHESCGDGIIQGQEECDDGGSCHDGSSCSLLQPSTCPSVDGAAARCVSNPCDSCNDSCQKVECGNGRKECAEECDDGNTDSGDGCNASCLIEFCGDGIVQQKLGETCDEGWGNSDITPGACRTNCQLAGCGDGVLDAGEECDVPTCPDGSACKTHDDCGGEWCLPRDGQGQCSQRCTIEGCGDGIVQPQYGEQCDDGNTDDGDDCSASCQFTFGACGDGIVQPEGADGIFGTLDDEECDYREAGSGICPLGSCDAGGVCDLGTCDLQTNRCTNANTVCATDADCQVACVPTCTQYCRNRALPCGDGYRDSGEQCDDGNRQDGDGCSFSCTIERPDLCGNGVVDEDQGEECDQGNPYATVECTPYCRLAQPAPMCGDGRKDPSGRERGDILGPLLSMTSGYRLDWRIPDGEQVLFPNAENSTLVSDVVGFPETQSAGGWYVTPRVFDRSQESAFQTITASRGERSENILDQRTCSACGDGQLDSGEQCDSGRLSGGSYPEQRVNVPAWQRDVWARTFTWFGSSYYWNWYWGFYPFGFHTYDSIASYWWFQNWNQGDYAAYLRDLYGGWYWYYADAAWDLRSENSEEGRTFVSENCSSSCTLQLCGNDRIDDGETCDDNNLSIYGSAQNGDGCSDTCFLEPGFTFDGAIQWPGGSQGITCGDDLVSQGEQCDDGARCIRRDGEPTSTYCRKEPGRALSFCDADGADNTPNTADDEIACQPVDGDGCNVRCQIEPVSVCGNGILEPYEQCDPGGRCSGDRSKTCTFFDSCNEAGTCIPVAGDGCTPPGSPIGACMFEPPFCGNGIIDPERSEACDPGSTCVGGLQNGSSCTGDSVLCVSGGGNCLPNPNDATCNASCQLRRDSEQNPTTSCGDGVLNGGEQCDDGPRNSIEPNHCRPNCLYPSCGDGVIDLHEECDDGNAVPYDGCSSCIVDLCGNGRLDTGETCDDGNRTSGDGCSLWCTRENVCGNSQLDPNEQCDDGNNWAGDGCSDLCQWEFCGDGTAQSGLGEQCDEGVNNAYAPDACKPDCTVPFCGDSYVDQFESCDPGLHCTNNPSQSCSDDLDCSLGPCDISAGKCIGDSSRSCTTDQDCGYATCKALDTDTCTTECTLKSVCGNGEREDGEQCDDRNTRNGDGCSSRCVLEQPERCGNGSIDPGEQCDDGNLANQDGCTETCQFETMQCPRDCSLPFVCEGTHVQCTLSSAAADCAELGVPCVMRPECAVECVFGSCGDGAVDPGEQCDDGRHCTHDPSQSCTTHSDCNIGSCTGADVDRGVPGICSGQESRSCMTDDDCQSLCVPMDGDGCSSACRFEADTDSPSTTLTLCQEEVSGGLGGRIGSDQVAIWKDTLLTPFENPFLGSEYLGTTRFLGSRGGAWWSAGWHWWDPDALTRFQQAAYPSYWGSAWWPSNWYAGWNMYWSGWYGWWSNWHTQCSSAAFPNSIGHLVQTVAGCLQTISLSSTMPDRSAILPLQPVGTSTYPACQEPRAQLASTVEIPAVSLISLPEYRPAELVRDVEQYICSESGFPRRSFIALCSETEQLAAPLPSEIFIGQRTIPLEEKQRAKQEQEMLLSHMLDIGYRSSESEITQYLAEAFRALRSQLDTALKLLADIQRIQFTDTVCPIDGTPLCTPAP